VRSALGAASRANTLVAASTPSAAVDAACVFAMFWFAAVACHPAVDIRPSGGAIAAAVLGLDAIAWLLETAVAGSHRATRAPAPSVAPGTEPATACGPDSASACCAAAALALAPRANSEG
jgi:hypothetical protein